MNRSSSSSSIGKPVNTTALKSTDGAYGMRTLRSLRNNAVSSKPSERLQKKIDSTYNYFLEEVDPVIGSVITHLLCSQPETDNIPNAMLEFLSDPVAPSVNEDGVALTSPKRPNFDNSGRPKKEQKLYLATSIGPVIAKLVNRIAVTRPKKVVEFLRTELTNMINGIDSDEATNELINSGNNSTANDNNNSNIDSTNISNNTSNNSNKSSSSTSVAAGTHSASSPSSSSSSSSSSSVTTTNIAALEQEATPGRCVQVAVLGVDSAGKSSMINMLQGKGDAKARPTIGFRPVSLMLGNDTRIRFYDLGGGLKIRDIWDQYYHDVHAVIYVVDSAAGDRLNETASLLQSTMQHNYLAGKPLLVLANKQDVAGAQSGKQIFDSLKLSSFQKASVAECMSIPLGGGEDPTAMDPRIESALESLLDTIQTNFEVLDQRVSADTTRKAEDESKKRLERERKVLRNKIACAFPDQVDPAFRPEAPSNPIYQSQSSRGFSRYSNCLH